MASAARSARDRPITARSRSRVAAPTRWRAPARRAGWRHARGRPPESGSCRREGGEGGGGRTLLRGGGGGRGAMATLRGGGPAPERVLGDVADGAVAVWS